MATTAYHWHLKADVVGRPILRLIELPGSYQVVFHTHARGDEPHEHRCLSYYGNEDRDIRYQGGLLSDLRPLLILV